MLDQFWHAFTTSSAQLRHPLTNSLTRIAVKRLDRGFCAGGVFKNYCFNFDAGGTARRSSPLSSRPEPAQLPPLGCGRVIKKNPAGL
jgi:hypothetical protein